MVLTITQITSLLLLILFSFLSGLHFYWAAGGKRWLKAAIPEIKGKPTIHPGPLATIAVAIGLLGFGALAFFLGFAPADSILPGFIYAGWIATAIFLIRAIGDFRYVGLFKTYRESGFARQDTRIYSPLCLFIATSFTVIIL